MNIVESGEEEGDCNIDGAVGGAASAVAMSVVNIEEKRKDLEKKAETLHLKYAKLNISQISLRGGGVQSNKQMTAQELSHMYSRKIQ